MRIPDKHTAKWASELVQQCSVSQKDRVERGAVYKNLYLSGSETGVPVTYNKTFAYMDNLASYLYSPVELRLNIELYGLSTAAERAKALATSSELHRYVRQGGCDTHVEEAVLWSLVKGKCFLKLLWTSGGLEPHVVQPECMGVLREDLSSLAEQEAFFHSYYLTPSRFAELVENREDRLELLSKVEKYIHPAGGGDNPSTDSVFKQVVLGDTVPFRDSAANKSSGRNLVNWLAGPAADVAPRVSGNIIRVDEIWVWDEERRDYTTLQLVGDDILLGGKFRHRNLLADEFDPDNLDKRLPPTPENPLTGNQPFIEFCPNRLDGYFWGRSEICNIAGLQFVINKRIDGINSLLRRQEDPNYAFTGTSVNQQVLAKLKKPGGYFSDANPNAKVQTLTPELPPGLWESLHEMEAMYDKMAGFTPTLQGRGEHGVRAAGHSESLTKNASPRFKDRALSVERSVEALGGLALDYLKAKVGEEQTAWVMPKEEAIEASMPADPVLDEAPVKGMRPVKFLFSQLPDKCKVVVDSHSSSPAFSGETRGLLFDLFKAGAVDKKQLVTHTAPPGQDTMLEDLIRAEISQQMFAEQHPEEAAKAQAGGKKRR